MVKVKKTKTEAPPTMLGIAMFNVDTSNKKIKPEHLLLAIAAFIIIEIALATMG